MKLIAFSMIVLTNLLNMHRIIASLSVKNSFIKKVYQYFTESQKKENNITFQGFHRYICKDNPKYLKRKFTRSQIEKWFQAAQFVSTMEQGRDFTYALTQPPPAIKAVPLDKESRPLTKSSFSDGVQQILHAREQSKLSQKRVQEQTKFITEISKAYKYQGSIRPLFFPIKTESIIKDKTNTYDFTDLYPKYFYGVTGSAGNKLEKTYAQKLYDSDSDSDSDSEEERNLSFLTIPPHKEKSDKSRS